MLAYNRLRKYHKISEILYCDNIASKIHIALHFFKFCTLFEIADVFSTSLTRTLRIYRKGGN